jgi:MEDS: MEthanogen/methylotroph, DcmR Sensory domain
MRSVSGDLQSTKNRADTKGGHMEHIDGWSSEPAEYHAVRFYDNDTSLARIVAEFLHQGFDRGGPGIVVASAIQREAIIRELTNRSLEVAELQHSHDLLMLDAEETLPTFMTDGKPDARKFRDRMCQAIESVCRGRTNCTVRIYGQMVDVLWQGGERDAAIRLEVLWNQLAQTEAFSLLCGYAIGNFYKDAGFEDICRQHSHMVSADGQANRVVSPECDRNQRRLESRRESIARRAYQTAADAPTPRKRQK